MDRSTPQAGILGVVRTLNIAIQGPLENEHRDVCEVRQSSNAYNVYKGESMKNNNWDGWLQISSTLTVLFGIALVVFELQQNSDLIELQIVKDDADKIDERILAILPQNMYEIRQKSIDDPSNLTHLEFRAVDAMLWSLFVNRWRSLYELAERGLLEEEVWQRTVREDAPLLAYPFGRAWWANVNDGDVVVLPPALVDAVDAVLADAPDNASLEYFKGALDRLEPER